MDHQADGLAVANAVLNRLNNPLFYAVLFGSKAKGCAGPDSDTDVIVGYPVDHPEADGLFDHAMATVETLEREYPDADLQVLEQWCWMEPERPMPEGPNAYFVATDSEALAGLPSNWAIQPDGKGCPAHVRTPAMTLKTGLRYGWVAL